MSTNSSMRFQEHDIQIKEFPFRLAYAREFPAEAIPAYWASLWPSSLALAEHVMIGEDLEGKKVLEIGCGSGLAGIAAGQKGAEVTITDLEQSALELAHQNWQLNDLVPAAVETLDWREPTIDETFDLILGADILYNPLDFPDLVHSLNDLMVEEGSLIISEPGRPHARDFFAKMLQAGYRAETAHYPVSLHGDEFEISVSELR